MQDASYQGKDIKTQFLSSHLHALQSLPDHKRKIFAIATLVIAIFGVCTATWFLFPPLQDLNLPSLDNEHIGVNADNSAQIVDGVNKLVDNSSLPDASKIPQIGPIKSFIDSFNAVKDMLAPKDVQVTSHDNVLEPWPHKLSQLSAELGSKTKAYAQYTIGTAKAFSQYLIARTLSYAPHMLDKLISSTSRTSQ